MRKSWILGGLVLAAFAAAALWWGGAPPPVKPPPDTPVAVAEPPAIAAPPAPAETPVAQSPATTAPAVAALPELPTRAVSEWRTHVVPEEAAPPPAKPLDLRLPSAGTAAAPADPAFRPFASLQLPASPGGAAPTGGARRGTGPQIAGAGEAAGATALRVGGQPLHLFGIRPPASGDRCAAPGTAAPGKAAQAGRTLPCLDQAQGLLAARVAGKANVSCRFPGLSRQDSPAICLDGEGVDLAGFLVAEGLALADPAQSYDYVGAEGIARAQKRGLWLFR